MYKHYLLTPRCRVLLEKLTGLQLVKKFPTFHRTRRFITAPTSVLHLSLSWVSPIQSIYPHPTSWRSILILSTHLRLHTNIITLKCEGSSPQISKSPPMDMISIHFCPPPYFQQFAHMNYISLTFIIWLKCVEEKHNKWHTKLLCTVMVF